MSRHSFFLKDDHPAYILVVGWDAGLQSFFLQYGDPGSDLPLILATGQRDAEHPTPDMIVALARHLGGHIPEDLPAILENDRQAEGRFDNVEIPELIMLTTQADNGAQLGFTMRRDTLPGIGIIADYIISGEAERVNDQSGFHALRSL